MRIDLTFLLIFLKLLLLLSDQMKEDVMGGSQICGKWEILYIVMEI